MELKNSVVCVTGASKGLGFGIAQALAREGACMTLTARGEEDLEAAAERIRAEGADVLTAAGDVGEEADAARMIDATMERWGRLDVLVNNAGFGWRGALTEMPVEIFDAMFRTNVRGVFLLTRLAAPIMARQGGGTIVNVSSLAGKNPVPKMAAYAASKWAVDGFTESILNELRGEGVRTMLVHPGSIDTQFDPPPAEGDKRTRILKPEDVADVLVAALKLDARANLSSFDIRPSNP